MKIHNIAQGSPEWISHRNEHWNASDAPSVMGCSPYKTRSQLLHELHVGVAPDVDAGTQRRFDDGHRFEALARPIAERIVGDDLYPVVGSDGEFSASFDGLSLDGDIAFEHKTLNDELRAVMVGGCIGADLPLMYRVQMEHQLLVSRAARVLFMASKWSGETLIEERHCWYLPDHALRGQIRAAWAQLERDLTEYVPPAAVAPTSAGKAPETLPALRIEVTGMVTASNLAEFKQTALTAIRAVNRDLTTDADFLDAAAAVKWCGDVEERLEAAKQHALSQTASIDALFKTIDDISAEARAVRLELDKLVTKRKAEIKEGIVLKAKAAYEAHVDALKRECGIWTLIPAPDFPGAAKNKRTLASLQDAVDVALANGKIAADAMAKSIREKLAALAADGAVYEFLFSDRPALVQKPLDDLKTIIAARISEHKAKEAARLEAETARIRAEEQAKAQREAAAKVAADAAAARAMEQPAPAPAVAPVAVAAARQVHIPPRPMPAPAVASEPANLNLGAICGRLGFNLTAAFVADTLGIQHAATDKSAKLFRESDFPRICDALVRHIAAVSELQAA